MVFVLPPQGFDVSFAASNKNRILLVVGANSGHSGVLNCDIYA